MWCRMPIPYPDPQQTNRCERCPHEETRSFRASRGARLRQLELEHRAGSRLAADVPTEDLADSMDILSIHVGAAFGVTAQVGISEIHSHPRIVAHAERAGFAPGWSLDLTVTDDQGQPYEFSKHECREKARQLIHKTKPFLLVGSPMCTWYSNSMIYECPVGGISSTNTHLPQRVGRSLLSQTSLPGTRTYMPSLWTCVNSAERPPTPGENRLQSRS